MVEFDKTPIVDLFVSVQGEGGLAGQRSIFIRTSCCNLRCKFKNSICDTPYSSYNPEKGKFTLKNVVDLVSEDPARYIVLTGGESTLYPDFIKWVKMSFPHHHLTLETNGTIYDKDLIRFVDLWSISPKMLSSIDPEDSSKEIRKALIEKTVNNISMIVENGRDVQLKYVVADEQDVLEALDHVNKIEDCLGEKMNRDSVYLMPAGSNFEELSKVRPIVGDLAIKYNFSLTDRIHINFWNDKREA